MTYEEAVIIKKGLEELHMAIPDKVIARIAQGPDLPPP